MFPPVCRPRCSAQLRVPLLEARGASLPSSWRLALAFVFSLFLAPTEAKVPVYPVSTTLYCYSDAHLQLDPARQAGHEQSRTVVD
ncbi:hypothetical protein C8Q77DRAFT_1147918 [Trametes polyzona]|nr:hypothetical protein C8Q77DRAFT_1147918 [Trametes polyzona]